MTIISLICENLILIFAKISWIIMCIIPETFNLRWHSLPVKTTDTVKQFVVTEEGGYNSSVSNILWKACSNQVY